MLTCCAPAADLPGAASDVGYRGELLDGRACGEADALMSDVFRALGLRASWPLRGVCRRWLRVVEETEWTDVELQIKLATDMYKTAPGRRRVAPAEQRDESLYDAVSALFEQRKLRLGAGASVSLSPELVYLSKKKNIHTAKQSEQRILAAACRLLTAIAGSHGGPQRSWGLSFALRGGEPGQPRIRSDRDHVCAYLCGVLRALAPPEGATSALESLSVSLLGVRPTETEWAPWPPAAADELRAALAPFRQLRSLELAFNATDAGIGPEAAAAVAASCPLLRSLCFFPCGEAAGEALAALAPLARLEELVALFTGRSPVSDSVLALGDGPAGQSLRRVEFVEAKPNREPQLRYPSSLAFGSVSSAVLHALGRMPKLESIEEMQLSTGRVTAESVRALGRAASLRRIDLEIEDYEESAGVRVLPALGEALSGLPRLERLNLVLKGDRTPPEGVLALLASDCARRALTGLHLSVLRPLAEAEAEAILALPALRRLRVACDLARVDPLDPYHVLAGIRPQVELDFDRDRFEDSDARHSMRKLFGARLEKSWGDGCDSEPESDGDGFGTSRGYQDQDEGGEDEGGGEEEEG
eukprot:tig00000269_g23689.t1